MSQFIVAWSPGIVVSRFDQARITLQLYCLIFIRIQVPLTIESTMYCCRIYLVLDLN